jgi:YD repeat-containing protein
VKKMTYGDLVSTVTTFGHDTRGRVTSSSSGVLGMNLTFGYDGDDNLTSMRNGVTNWENSLNYDSLGQLSWATSWYGTYAYDYDTLGNRILKSGAQTTSAAYDSSNRLSTACGPERFKTMTFTWNQAGRLASSSDGATYSYDGGGRRVKKVESTGTTLYHYDAGGLLIAETTDGGASLRDYLYLNGKLVAVYGCISGTGSCTELQWYQTDPLGSVLSRTDYTGATVGVLQQAGEPARKRGWLDEAAEPSENQ